MFDFFGVFDVENEELVASPVCGGVFRFCEEVQLSSMVE